MIECVKERKHDGQEGPLVAGQDRTGSSRWTPQQKLNVKRQVNAPLELMQELWEDEVSESCLVQSSGHSRPMWAFDMRRGSLTSFAYGFHQLIAKGNKRFEPCDCEPFEGWNRSNSEN